MAALDIGCESSDNSSDNCECPAVPKPYMYEPYCSDADADDDSDEENHETASSSLCDPTDRLQLDPSSTWCTCTCCIPMPTQRECICCKEIKKFEDLLENVPCITEHPGFQPVCLNPYVLQTAYYQYRQQYGQEIADINSRYRYTAYRQLTRFVWGYLGKGIRVVLPACAVSKIRKTFPSKDGQYVGYLEA